jgi:hypothetical protein
MELDEFGGGEERTREYVVITPLKTGHAQAGSLVTGNASKFVSAEFKFRQPQEFTVTVDLDLPTDGFTAFAQATVTWAVGGVPVSRTFDVAAGISISGVAEAVKVTVNDITPVGHTFGLSYSASILFAANPRPTSAVPVIKTGVAAATVANAGTTSANVPRGASSVAIYSSATSGLTITCMTLDGTTILQTTSIGQFIPLPSGTGQVQVSNGSGAQASISILWGMDG